MSAQNTTKVLFIGNSITYYNNMPQTFESIANSKGDLTEITMHAPGGTGILNHVNDSYVYDLFRQGVWDYVVLQPGSNESPGYSETKEQTLGRLNKLKDSIYRYNPCSKILLYEIPYGVYGNSQSDIDSYNDTMGLIRSNCEYWSDEAEIFFAPAGETVKNLWNNDPSTLLWIGYSNVHPNEKGSYIIACSIYAAIFQKPSYGTNEISTLSQQDATFYQQAADAMVLNHLSDWRINTYNQHTDFDYNVNHNQVSFSNLSQNYDTLEWNFGDGTTSNTDSPVHTYNQTGTFDVTLTTYNNTCSETLTHAVDISSLQISSSTDFSYKIFPNPFENRLYIEGSFDTDILIKDLLGRDFTQLIKIDKTNKGLYLDTTDLPAGWYLINNNNFIRVIYKK